MEICDDEEGATKTHIMYKGNFGYKQLKKYMKLLLRYGHLDSFYEKDGKLVPAPDNEPMGNRIYKTSEEGLKAKNDYNEVVKKIKEIGW